MRVSRSSLALLLAKSVVELKFRRRIEKQGYSDFRRMLCTNDRMLLNSALGRNILNFNPPHGMLPYNAAAKNLVIAWDLFMQNFRAINCNEVDVVSVISTQPSPTQWWAYFGVSIAPMPPDQKLTFMNS
jgi:hypothetical protein